MKKKKEIIITLLCLLVAVPAFAVFNEKNLTQTLSVLRFELHQQNEKMENSRSRLIARNERQHEEMIAMVKKCNELSLILYSQNQDYTFDMTYALQEVTDKYEDFSSRRMPYDELVTNLNLEIERYERLIESLRRLPPALDKFDEIPDSIAISKDSLDITYVNGSAHIHFRSAVGEGHDHETFMLDEQDCINRDSCIYYSRNLLRMYTEIRDQIVEDNEHYDETNARMKEAYDYAQNRYRLIQRNIFIKGQDSYFKVLATFPSYCKRAFQEAVQKYKRASDVYDDGCAVEKKDVFTAVAEAVGIGKDAHAHEDEHGIIMDEEGPHIHADDIDELVDQAEAAEAKEAAEEEDHDHDHEGEDEHHHHHHGNQSEWRGPVVTALIAIVFFFIILAASLCTMVITVLKKKIAWFRTPSFIKRQQCVSLLTGVAIFAVTIMIANRIVEQNFIVMACGLLMTFAWLVAAILCSILIRVPAENTNRTLRCYIPMMIMGLIVITFRIIFIPNKLINLIFPPILLAFAIWQHVICKRATGHAQKVDRIYSWITFFVLVITTIMAWMGFVLLSVQVFIWWLFQLAAITTVTALYDLLDKYESARIVNKIEKYKAGKVFVNSKERGTYIEVTWLYDLVKDTIVPIIAILTIPFSIYLASEVFDLTEVCKTVLLKPFFNLSDTDGNAILHLSLFKILVICEMFFVFRYISYAAKSFYKHIKTQRYMERTRRDYVHTHEINFTLANNLVSIITWGIYIIMVIVMLRIPMGALSVVAAGLATGIGLALKDVLNNFIYGIQLMSGRLRVGDFIECDGVRGKVDFISYQSTQIITLDGSVMAFPNATLFNKNFKNLTRNNDYELVKIPVGVHYGADVNKVRECLTEALKQLQTKDTFGRWIVDPKKGLTIAFSDFGDSSIDLVVKQYVIVDQQANYIAAAKEIIYNTLNENNIEIPFPQRDIYIRQMPESQTK